jgi:Amt family ammonium transporter
LVILDQQMPDMDGMELAVAIKADPLLRDVPLLMLTSIGGNLEPHEASRLGLSGVLTKPIRQSRLFDSIVDAIRRAPVRDASCATPAGGTDQVTTWRAAARVLVVDDNEINRLVTGEMLASEGYNYDLATNGREAIEALHVQRYDAVLMDCQMPEMNGFEATREIRRLEAEGSVAAFAHRRVSIIALTANAVRGDREKCLAAEMDDYVTKPIDRGQLLATLDAHVRPRLAQHELAAVAPQAVGQAKVACPTVSETASICVQGLLERCQGDSGFAAKMLRKFQASAPGEITKIRRALVAHDAQTAGRLAHTLRGASGMLSIERIQQLAEQIETFANEQGVTDALECMADLEVESQRVFDQLEQILEQLENSP